jgi:hypothetical protein
MYVKDLYTHGTPWAMLRSDAVLWRGVRKEAQPASVLPSGADSHEPRSKNEITSVTLLIMVFLYQTPTIAQAWANLYVHMTLTFKPASTKNNL